MSNTQMGFKLLEYFRIMRPHRILRLNIPLAILVGSLAISTLIENLRAYVFIVISILIAHAGAIVINDVFDLEVDKANKENRPLVRGTVSKNEAYMLFIFLNIMTLAILHFLVRVPAVTLIIAACILFSIIYSVYPRTIDMGLIGVLTLSGILVMTIIAIGIILFKDFNELVVISILGLLYILPNAIIKDFKDYVGDKACGKNTYVVDVGIEKATRIVAFLLITLSIAAPIIVILYYHIYAAVISLIPFSILCYYSISALKKMRDNYSSNLAKEFQAKSMLLMGASLITIAVSSIAQYFYFS